ncbi:MAG: DUF2868 domain-containing protein [Burkholderiales bacterium]|nr:DUF2868 domain-containing protein [Burkholderiales bacterium]
MTLPPDAGLHLTEQALRSVTLAQALERADTAHTLVSTVEWDEATQQALAAARARGVQAVGLGDVVCARAERIVERASARDATVAALRLPRGRALAWALPAAALLAGLVLDRIANAHRVDLLSPPLLAVLAWNLAVYALLLWQALRRPGSPPALLQALPVALRRWRAPAGRGTRRGLSARIAAEFEALWLARSAALLARRAAAVLHLCAAAWAAGIALSLLLRGLVVSYRFGWESTFLDAAQVHAIVSVLFAPLTVLLGLAPFSAQDIAATQDFAGQGVAGSRWVGMYVGLLLLAVVLPRLLLAAWALWRAARSARRCTLDLGDGSFEALRQALPVDWVLGLLGVGAAQVRALGGGLHSALGDRLRWALPDAAASTPVDAVLVCDAAHADPVPAAWQAAPRLACPWAAWGASWMLEERLFERLAVLWPQHGPALQRLRQARVAQNEACFAQALQALARCLRACAAAPQDDGGAAGARALQALDAELRALHGHAPPAEGGAAGEGAGAPRPARPAGGVALAVGTSAGAAAGAAAGAKVGALIDLGTGGLTLGAGTALGALLGGATAWMVRSAQKKDAAQEQLWQCAEQACTHYLVIAHEARVLPADAAPLARRWRAEVTATVAAHGAALAAALQQPSDAQDALLPVLDSMLRGMVQRSVADAAWPVENEAENAAGAHG